MLDLQKLEEELIELLSSSEKRTLAIVDADYYLPVSLSADDLKSLVLDASFEHASGKLFFRRAGKDAVKDLALLYLIAGYKLSRADVIDTCNDLLKSNGLFIPRLLSYWVNRRLSEIYST